MQRWLFIFGLSLGLSLGAELQVEACSFKEPRVIITVDSDKFTHHELKDLAASGAVFVIDYPVSGLSLKRIYELKEVTAICLRQVDENLLGRAEILELVRRGIQLNFQTSTTKMDRFELKEILETPTTP